MSQPEVIDTPENWSAASEAYANNVAPLMMETYAQEVCELVGVSSEDDVLEVAAGSGALTRTLARHAKSVLVTDFAPDMLAINEKTLDSQLAAKATFKVMDGQALDVPDNAYDKAACMFGLMLFPDRAKGFSELFRVLKPQGSAVVIGWAGPDKFEVFGLFLQALQQAFPDRPKPDAPPPVFRLADLDVFKTEMESAGFRNVTTTYVTREFNVDGFDTFWPILTSGAPPVKMLLDAVGEQGGEHLKQTLKDIIEDKFGAGPITFSNTATVGVGVKA